ncbi:hypothetical protein GCM10023214_54460 [Amycolatopsis dongchuanensis]|uniref:Uncharacterized protein n=1 Tax=Amycolatopsis dongchuanensis TaxID=1070866 RepID=A0ABP9R7N6_9PSEU
MGSKPDAPQRRLGREADGSQRRSAPRGGSAWPGGAWPGRGGWTAEAPEPRRRLGLVRLGHRGGEARSVEAPPAGRMALIERLPLARQVRFSRLPAGAQVLLAPAYRFPP